MFFRIQTCTTFILLWNIKEDFLKNVININHFCYKQKKVSIFLVNYPFTLKAQNLQFLCKIMNVWDIHLHICKCKFCFWTFNMKVWFTQKWKFLRLSFVEHKRRYFEKCIMFLLWKSGHKTCLVNNFLQNIFEWMRHALALVLLIAT